MVARVLEDATPIKTPSPVEAKRVRMNTNKKFIQFRGNGASKKIGAVKITMADTTTICKIMFRGGIITIDEAGTPLTL